jgi:hypothetical protein
VTAGGERIVLQHYDRIVVPQGMGPLEITPDQRVVLLECLPPGAEIAVSDVSVCTPSPAGRAGLPPAG